MLSARHRILCVRPALLFCGLLLTVCGCATTEFVQLREKPHNPLTERMNTTAFGVVKYSQRTDLFSASDQLPRASRFKGYDSAYSATPGHGTFSRRRSCTGGTQVPWCGSGREFTTFNWHRNCTLIRPDPRGGILRHRIQVVASRTRTTRNIAALQKSTTPAQNICCGLPEVSGKCSWASRSSCHSLIDSCSLRFRFRPGC